MSDWVSNVQAEPSSPENTAGQGFRAAARPVNGEIPEEPIPDWLVGIGQDHVESGEPPALPVQGPEPASPGGSDAGLPMETPGWLSLIKPEASGQEPASQAAEEPSPEAIEKAELPSWVQAMRPLEAVVDEIKPPLPDEGSKPEEGGPLDSLRGVLPAGTGQEPVRKPSAFSNLLQVNAGQQRHAALLERIVSTEAKPHPAKAGLHLSSVRLLRWAIALVLLLAVGLPLITNVQFVSTKMPSPPEMIVTMNLIGGLPSGSPVLLIFDYEPALSGELEAAAAPVIDHLLSTHARLSLLSTSPTGPALAERFLLDTQAGNNYQAGQQYVNLGYLAGGQAGVLAFAQDPVAAAPFSVDGGQAWQTPPLKGVRKLSDLSAMLVLTDNADTGRTWIEQAGAYLNNTPLLMVISAQAEPMLRPYYDSGQIKGLVAGLAGGAAYEQAVQRPNLGGSYWNAFNGGILAAVLMIVVGALWSAISASRTRRLASGEEL